MAVRPVFILPAIWRVMHITFSQAEFMPHVLLIAAPTIIHGVGGGRCGDSTHTRAEALPEPKRSAMETAPVAPRRHALNTSASEIKGPECYPSQAEPREAIRISRRFHGQGFE